MENYSALISDIKPQQRSKLFWYASDSFEMLRRSVRHIIRNMDQLLSVAMFPIMFMLLNRYVFGGAIKTGISYVNFLFPGILIQMLAFGANTTTINLAVDMKEGIIDRFKSLPMNGSSLLIGHVVTDLVRNFMSGIIITIVGYLVGFRPTAGLKGWLLTIALAMLFSFAISWISAVMGLMIKSLEAAQWVGFVAIFPITFISSAFVPTNTMPRGLRAFAENQPISLVINSIRHLLVGTPDFPIVRAVIWLVAIIAVCLPLATVMYRRKNSR